MAFKLSRFLAGMLVPVIIGIAVLWRDSDEKLMTRIVYSEAASQSQIEKELVAKTILNRVQDAEYPPTVKGVVYYPGAFSSIGSKNWRESKFPRFRNDIEEKSYQQCRQAVRNVKKGKRLGISRENEIVAFCSGGKPEGKYWDSLEVVAYSENMGFCAPKIEKLK